MPIRSLHTIIFLLFLIQAVSAQNLVLNPNFTELDSCPYNFGQIYFATGWNSDNDQSPDLFDSCVTGPFYGLPIVTPCTTVSPYQDNGFVGIVTFGKLPNGNNVREIMTARLSEAPPEGVDIYCSMAVRPRPRCESPSDIPSHLCYSDGVGLAIIYENQNREIVVRAETLINNRDEWTILKGCYEAKGEEERIQIQNFYDDSQTQNDCEIMDDPSNISYTYVDNVVVAPFDILLDTLVVCDIDELQFEGIHFYNLDLSWEDGVIGGARTFELSGRYTLLADAEDCMLEEPIVIIVVDEQVVELEEVITKCLNEPITLSIDIPGEVTWNNNLSGSSISVFSEGSYIATVVSECNTLEYVFKVSEIDCDEVIYAANIFSPNGDGVNESIEFHQNPMLTLEGTLRIFDRWGVLVFLGTTSDTLQWDGRSGSGSPLSQGVYIWTFVSQDQSITQSGDITLIR